jgi:hypothetical protein
MHRPGARLHIYKNLKNPLSPIFKSKYDRFEYLILAGSRVVPSTQNGTSHVVYRHLDRIDDHPGRPPAVPASFNRPAPWPIQPSHARAPSRLRSDSAASNIDEMCSLPTVDRHACTHVACRLCSVPGAGANRIFTVFFSAALGRGHQAKARRELRAVDHRVCINCHGTCKHISSTTVQLRSHHQGCFFPKQKSEQNITCSTRNRFPNYGLSS